MEKVKPIRELLLECDDNYSWRQILKYDFYICCITNEEADWVKEHIKDYQRIFCQGHVVLLKELDAMAFKLAFEK